MSRGKKIKYVVIHCQAGHGNLESVQAYWKTLGWKGPGYNTWIDYDGTRHNLAPYESQTNGVKGFAAETLHISYRGGVLRDNVNKASDTRTPEQKDAILAEILQMLLWLDAEGNDMQDVMIVGHYHFSTDQNKNGAIESWERIKECPSFDAYTEYKDFFDPINKNYSKLKLPKNR